MMTVLFGQVATGRLARLRYLGWSLFVGLLGLAIVMGIGVAIGAAENLVGGDIESAQNQIWNQLGLPSIIVLAIVFVMLLFCSLNLMAKRIRDIGLPGWWTVLAIIVLGGVISSFVSEAFGSTFHLLVWLALLLVPTAALCPPTSA